MTPNCLRRLMSPYAARVAGYQGHRSFPHSVMAVGIKAPAPGDVSVRARRLVAAYQRLAAPRQVELAGRRQKLRRALAQVYRSKGERHQIADYYAADFTIEVESHLALAG